MKKILIALLASRLLICDSQCQRLQQVLSELTSSDAATYIA